MKTNEQTMLNTPINPLFMKKNDYDKYGDGTYVPTDVYVRGMNEVFGPLNWAYYVTDEKDKDDFILVRVSLEVNGKKVREEYGSARKDKKDNSSAFNTALSYGLKKCIARLGLFPNLEKNWDVPLFNKPVVKISAEELKEKVDDLKMAYNIETKEEFVEFAQIWDKGIKQFSDLTKEKLVELYEYVKENEKEFENFKESIV